MNLLRLAKYKLIKLRQWATHHKRLCIIVGDIILLLLLARQLWPVSGSEAARNQVEMRIESYYELTADGHPVFFFADIDDSLEAKDGSVNVDSIVTCKTSAPGYWVNRISFLPSCMGRILTLAPPKASRVVGFDSTELRHFLMRQTFRSDQRLAGLQRMKNELHYYVRTHDVADFGFTQIAQFSSVIDRQVDSLQTIVDSLQNIRRGAKLAIRYVTRYAVIRSTESGDTINRLCRLRKTYNGQFALVQTINHLTPLSVHTRLSIGSTPALLKKEEESYSDDGVAGLAIPSDSVVTMEIDSVGIYVGQVSVDTTSSSTSSAVSLLSKDDRDRTLVPQGLGKMYYFDGGYYEGYWTRGKRNGFGFYVSPDEYLQVGTWKFDVFKGEKLTYNANRIYGIDLSRHQHERNGRKYSIDWSNLRITSLGSSTKKDVKGKVDYPVSFVYIKSTEGCTVLNSYFNSDYTMAKKKGMHVGAYHFFSTTSSGTKQAWEFLKKTRIAKGDLAPVLDIEPTDAQVRNMGGETVLLNNVRAWLKIVYTHTKTRPILYVGQDFAHKYLSHASDIIGNHLVWIARYGEYQPSLRLAIWQLSSDGHVNGIHGNVDINVFCGYKDQFNNFIENHTIK